MTGDVQLLRRYAASRDAEAFTAILRRHQGLVYGTCLRVLGNTADAEDAAQECFFRLARHAETIHSSLSGWLHACAMHVSLNAFEKSKARARREKVYSENKGDDEDDASEVTWREIAPIVDQAIAELPDELRSAVIERFLQQRTQAEVAGEMGVSRTTLTRRLNAGIKLIRQKLKGAGVLASVAVLTGLLAENAIVASPASLKLQLGKLAIAGIGPIPVVPPVAPQRPAARPVAKARVPLTAASGAAGGGLAVKVAVVFLATAVAAVGIGVGVSLYLDDGDGDAPADVGAVTGEGRGTNDGVSVGPVGSAGGAARGGPRGRRVGPGRRPDGRSAAPGTIARTPWPERLTAPAGVGEDAAPNAPDIEPAVGMAAQGHVGRDVEWTLVPARFVPGGRKSGMKWVLVPVTSLPEKFSSDGEARGRKSGQDDPNSGAKK